MYIKDTKISGSLFFINPVCLLGKWINIGAITHFIKPYRDQLFVNWILVRFYETGCICKLIGLQNYRGNVDCMINEYIYMYLFLRRPWHIFLTFSPMPAERAIIPHATPAPQLPSIWNKKHWKNKQIFRSRLKRRIQFLYQLREGVKNTNSCGHVVKMLNKRHCHPDLEDNN